MNDKPSVLDHEGLDIMLAAIYIKLVEMVDKKIAEIDISGGSGTTGDWADVEAIKWMELMSLTWEELDEKISSGEVDPSEVCPSVDQLQSILSEYSKITYVDQSIADLMDTSPEVLTALQQITVILNENPDIEAGLLELIGSKVSQEEFDELKTKVATLTSKVNALMAGGSTGGEGSGVVVDPELESRVAALEGANTTLQSSNSTLESKTTVLETKVSDLESQMGDVMSVLESVCGTL